MLIGVAFGIGYVLLFRLRDLSRVWLGAAPDMFGGHSELLLGARQLIASLFLSNIFQLTLISLFMFFLLLLLHGLTRRQWLAASIWVLIWILPIIADPGPRMINLLISTLSGLLVLFVMLRSSLLALASGCFVFGPVGISTSDFSAWYGGTSLTLLAVVLALAVYAFHTSLGGQKVFAGKLLEE
jgi:hypothetical protein